jgi:hypothetical protein
MAIKSRLARMAGPLVIQWRRPSSVVALPITLALMSVAAAADTLTLDVLLDRATAYELAFIQQLSNVVAEEQYVQETLAVSLMRTGPAASQLKRVLKADFLLVSYPGATKWQAFRQVLEVDGKSVRATDDDARLMQLFAHPAADAFERATAIAREGTRYNLTDIGTLNNPLLALGFLQPEYRQRFGFTLGGVAKQPGPKVRTVRFRETGNPTILGAAQQGENLASSGQMWIEEDTGRVAKTELRVMRVSITGAQRPIAEIVTTFAFDAELGMNVPSEMRDWYPSRATSNFSGTARYSHFRCFQVHTEERPRQ